MLDYDSLLLFSKLYGFDDNNKKFLDLLTSQGKYTGSNHLLNVLKSLTKFFHRIFFKAPTRTAKRKKKLQSKEDSSLSNSKRFETESNSWSEEQV